MISRTALCSAQVALRLRITLRVTLGTSRSRSGASSSTAKVSSPKASTIRRAVVLPMPSTAEIRKRCIPSIVWGSTARKDPTANCRP